MTAGPNAVGSGSRIRAMGVSGMLSVEVVQLRCVTGLQLDQASRAWTTSGDAVARKEQDVADLATMAVQQRQDFSHNPTSCSDKTYLKTSGEGPDILHPETEDGLRTDNQSKPGCVQVKLSTSLQDSNAHTDVAHLAPGSVIDGVNSVRDNVNVERVWYDYFQHPTDWWDCRRNKLHPNFPDFTHQSTKEALWICSSNTPRWVKEAFERKAGGQSMEACTSYGDCTPGSAVKSKISDRDVLSWTASILQHIKCGQDRQALRIYRRMRESGMKVISNTFVAALKACSSLLDLESAKKIHADVVNSGYDSDVYVGTMLVDVYGKCRRLADARQVFENMPHRNVVSWNAMILACAQMEEGEEAVQLYAQMQQEGVVPNDRTFVAVLKACSSLASVEPGDVANGKHVKLQSLKLVRAIHFDTVKSGSESVYVGTMLVDAYAKCGSLVDARHVFEKMPHRDVACWNAMILGYVQMEEGHTALQLYASMEDNGVSPDERTFVGALKACCSLAAPEAAGLLWDKSCLEKLRAIHSQVLKSRCESDVFVGTMLVDAYAKCGSLGDARCVFEKMPYRNVVSWTAMIWGYAQREEGEEALQLYRQMQQESVVPDARTFVAALKACGCLAARDEGMLKDGKGVTLEHVRAIHSDVLKTRSESDVFVGNMLVDVYGKFGSLADAWNVFDSMPHRDVVSWTAMILGYVQMEQGEVALQLYDKMQLEGFTPDARAFVGALKACGMVSGLEKGKEIHAEISKSGLEATDVFVASSLIDMYGRCGSMVDAQQVFDALPTRGSVTWRALIAGYARQGDSDRVFELFQMMKEGGIQPESNAFVALLTVCSHVGLVDKGQSYFEAMTKEFGITPTMEHYSCMIDLLGRAGQLDKAMGMAKMIPSHSDGTVWRTLLNACRKWANVEIGREAFEFALRLDRTDPAAYLLMSSIYAAAHMWEDAEGIQAMRMDAGSWKQPGQSRWTDMDGTVHSFAVRDQEHPEIQGTYAELEQLFLKMEEDLGRST